VTIRLLTGDCRDVLPTLASNSVHTVVTSPPYYGLRDYGTALWDGGDAACDHAMKQPKRGNAEYTNGQGGSFASNLQAWGDRDVSSVYRDTCGKCGARRIDRQIGLEPTPDAYIATMVAVFREVRRILRNDGVMFLNIGDSYVSSGGMTKGGSDFSQWTDDGTPRARVNNDRDASNKRPTGLKPKDLLLMPARLALALQADGWWVRSDIIWAKPNPMPESCRDRPTSAHEHVFLLTKKPRYYFDADAVREEAEYGYSRETGAAIWDRAGKHVKSTTTPGNGGTRNLRNVWTIATAPYAEAHFATFPPLLAERCIRAGTSERGCCAACGAPWVRVTERSFALLTDRSAERCIRPKISDAAWKDGWDGVPRGTTSATTTGWAASCACGAETQPCTVLDPFAGSGTTLLVADRLQRHAVGIDLSTTYADMAKNRVTDDCPLFTSWAPAEDPEDERMRDLFQDMAAD
jgi:DNA modification methylase